MTETTNAGLRMLRERANDLRFDIAASEQRIETHDKDRERWAHRLSDQVKDLEQVETALNVLDVSTAWGSQDKDVVSYVEGDTNRERHMRVEQVQDAPLSGVGIQAMNWLPLAKGRFCDAPVTGTDGLNYMAIIFDLPLERQVKHLITGKQMRRTDRADVEAAIKRLHAYLETLPVVPKGMNEDKAQATGFVSIG